MNRDSKFIFAVSLKSKNFGNLLSDSTYAYLKIYQGYNSVKGNLVIIQQYF